MMMASSSWKHNLQARHEAGAAEDGLAGVGHWMMVVLVVRE